MIDDAVPLPLYARVVAAFGEGRPRSEVLEHEGLSEGDWDAAEARWVDRLLESADSDLGLVDELERALAEQRRAFARPIKPLDEDYEAFLAFQGAMQASEQPLDFLRSRELSMGDWIRLAELWAERLAAEKALLKRAAVFLAGAAPPLPAPIIVEARVWPAPMRPPVEEETVEQTSKKATLASIQWGLAALRGQPATEGEPVAANVVLPFGAEEGPVPLGLPALAPSLGVVIPSSLFASLAAPIADETTLGPWAVSPQPATPFRLGFPMTIPSPSGRTRAPEPRDGSVEETIRITGKPPEPTLPFGQPPEALSPRGLEAPPASPTSGDAVPATADVTVVVRGGARRAVLPFAQGQAAPPESTPRDPTGDASGCTQVASPSAAEVTLPFTMSAASKGHDVPSRAVGQGTVAFNAAFGERATEPAGASASLKPERPHERAAAAEYDLATDATSPALPGLGPRGALPLGLEPELAGVAAGPHTSGEGGTIVMHGRPAAPETPGAPAKPARADNPASLSLQQYAALRAELDVNPKNVADILKRYELTVDTHATIDALYRPQVTADRDSARTFDRAYSESRRKALAAKKEKSR